MQNDLFYSVILEGSFHIHPEESILNTKCDVEIGILQRKYNEK